MLGPIIGQIFASDRGCLTLTLGVIPVNVWMNFASPETRVIVLSDTEDRIHSSGQNTSMWKTDKFAIANTALRIASNLAMLWQGAQEMQKA